VEDFYKWLEAVYNVGGIWGFIAFINVLSFVLFAVDKFQAKSKGWRISEKVLLTLSALGGAVGGWFAMEIFRHKTKTPVFKFGLPIMMLAHFVIIGIIIVL